jgi:branched-chain amino acid transport system permease protein
VAARLGATRTFQNLQVFGSSTVLGNVMVGRHLRSRAGLARGATVLWALHEEAAVRHTAAEILTGLGLEEHLHRSASELSFGQQRLVELARVLALEPSLILVDEPLAGLSRTESEAVVDLLGRLRDRGVGILMVEHNVEAVMAVADRVAVLDEGRMIALGAPEDVRGDRAVVAAYLGSSEDLLEPEAKPPADGSEGVAGRA